MNSDTAIWILVAGTLTAVIVVLLVRLLALSGDRGAKDRDLLDKIASDLAGLERQKRRSEEILERMTEGVMVLDESLQPVVANGAARTLLGLQRVSLPDRLPSEEVLAVARRAFQEDAGADEVVNAWFPGRRNLRVRAAALADRQGVVVVIEDVTEELRAQRTRREFVAHASHELKSPVASLQTLAEAVRSAVADDPKAAARFSERLVGEAERLGRLVTDLLDLSRLEHPENVSQAPVDLSATARRELRAVEEGAEAKGLRIVSDIAGDVLVKGDDQQLGLMIRNLLDNAVRYTSRGDVSLTLRRERAEAVLEIADTGMGIPLEAQERVFERFYRIDRARSRDRGGTGLGLAIVKHAVELHGGRIQLESELHQGSRFTIRLPQIFPGPARMPSIAG